MILHLIRHAQAVERSREITEEHRWLSGRGRKRFRQVAAALRKLAIEPEAILTSPKIRAVQTADILAEALRFAGEVQLVPAIAAGFDGLALRQLLVSRPAAAELVVIGHEPDCGLLVTALLRLDTPCLLSKGSVVTLEVTVTNSGLAARLLRVITGGGRVIDSKGKALERLQCTDTSVKEGTSQ